MFDSNIDATGDTLMSYASEIVKALHRLGKNGTENPDSKHNTGRLLGEAFMWDAVSKFAEKRKEAAWEALLKEGIAPERSTLDPGEVEFASSPSFVGKVKATQPVKKFSVDALATALKASKYKVPEPVTKQLCEAAKVPTKSNVSYSVIEKS